MSFSLRTALVKGVLALTLASGPAFAAGASEDPGKVPPVTRESSADMHNKMAQMHKNMADCLKSDKPMDVCRRDMLKECRDITKTGKCPMGEQMAGHKGKPSAGMSGSSSRSY